MDQEILDVFLEEFTDMLNILNGEISKFPSKNIVVGEIFRVFHTLKGNSATIEHMRLYQLTNFYCEYFRSRQKNNSLTEKEYLSLVKCHSALLIFQMRISNGKKGQRIKIAPLMKILE